MGLDVFRVHIVALGFVGLLGLFRLYRVYRASHGHTEAPCLPTLGRGHEGLTHLDADSRARGVLSLAALGLSAIPEIPRYKSHVELVL